MRSASVLPGSISNLAPRSPAVDEPVLNAPGHPVTNRPCRATKAELERVLNGAIAGGLNPERVEVEGKKIVVYAATSNDGASDLDNWRRKNGDD